MNKDMEMISKIDKLLEDEVRPSLAAHGGSVEVIDVDNDQVFIIFRGGCQGCSQSNATINDAIEKIIQKKYPNLKVVDLTDHTLGKNPYFKD